MYEDLLEIEILFQAAGGAQVRDEGLEGCPVGALEDRAIHAGHVLVQGEVGVEIFRNTDRSDDPREGPDLLGDVVLLLECK